MKSRPSSAARQSASAVEHERRRISQELHRHLNQSLTGLSLMLEAVTQEDVQGHEAADVVVPAAQWMRILQLAQEAVRDAHRLHDRLAPLSRQRLHLAQGLYKLVEDVGAGLKVELECDSGAVEKITRVEVQTALYRIAQEAIDNVARHAGATRLEVRCTALPDGVKLEILDNGKGFEPRPITAADGGWRLMEQQAKAIGATLRLERREGGGSRVECEAPTA